MAFEVDFGSYGLLGVKLPARGCLRVVLVVTRGRCDDG